MIERILNIHKLLWERCIDSSQLSDKHISSLLKLLVISFVLLFLPNAIWISSLPQGLFNPPTLSIAYLFNDFPNYLISLIIHIAIIVSLVLIGVNYKRRLFAIVFFSFYIILMNFKYSLGKIDHNILLPITILCFSLTGWKSYDTKGKDTIITSGVPASTLLAIFICFGMFTAGLGKAVNWLDFNTSTNGFLNWFNYGYYNLDRTLFLSDYTYELPKTAFEFIDYAAVFIELTPFLFLLAGKQYWRFWLLLASCFHVLNILILNIPFLSHSLVFLVFLTPIFLIKWIGKIPKNYYNLSLIVVSVIQLYTLIEFNTTLLDLFFTDLRVFLLFCLATWLLTILCGIQMLRNK